MMKRDILDNIQEKLPCIGIIVPCYNESAVIDLSNAELVSLLRSMKINKIVSNDSFIVYVNDGSKDNTWEKIESIYLKNPEDIKAVSLSRNSGHQNALLAGIEYCLQTCAATITIDADLQDDPSVILEMIKEFEAGNDVVYGVRKNRMSDSRFKRKSAQTFYSLMNSLGAETIYNHADFRLLSKRSMEDLMNFKERNLFLRGIIPTLGYNQTQVYYDRKQRKAGETKYPLHKMMEFALDGVTSFSVKPIRMLFFIGFLFMILSIGVGIYTLTRYIGNHTIEGWTSLILSIWFCTGIILMGMGITGEYIGKIYTEVKQRPRYKIDKILSKN